MEPFARLPKRLLLDDRLPAAAKNLFGWLDAYLDKKSGRCEPTIGQLSAKLDLSRRYVIILLELLEQTGYIAIERASGRRNSYRLLPEFTREIDFTGPDEFTGEVDFTSPVKPTSPVNSVSPNSDLKNSSQERAEPAPDRSLFASSERSQLRSEIYDGLGRHSVLAGFRDWFPDLGATFFISQGWQARADGSTAVHWAFALVKICAKESEVREAFDWAAADGPTPLAKPDQLRRIIRRINSRRDVQLTPGCNTARTAGDLAGLWIHRCRTPGRKLRIDELTAAFQAMIDAGHSIENLRLEIIRANRDASETFGCFQVRMSRSRARPESDLRESIIQSGLAFLSKGGNA